MKKFLWNVLQWALILIGFVVALYFFALLPIPYEKMTFKQMSFDQRIWRIVSTIFYFGLLWLAMHFWVRFAILITPKAD